MSFERLLIEELRRRKKAEEEASRTLRVEFDTTLKAAVAEGLLPHPDTLEGWQRVILVEELSKEVSLDFSSIRWAWHRAQSRFQQPSMQQQATTDEIHNFELEVEAEVLAALMTRLGREVEANGGEYHLEGRGFTTLLWRVNAIPEITTEGEAVILTWRCGYGDESNGMYPQMDTPCIRWKITPAFLGIRVKAFCVMARFKPFFYDSINFAEDMATQAQEKENRRLEGLAEDWWAAVGDDIPADGEQAQQPGPEGQTSQGDELPIPEGKTRYTPADWAAIFRWASKPGTRPDYYEIARLTGKTYRTVKKEYSKWRDSEGDEMSP